MLNNNRKGRVSTLYKPLLTACLLGGAALLSSPAKAGLIADNSCSFGTDATHPLCNSYNWADDYMQLGDKILRLDLAASTSLAQLSGTINFTNSTPGNWTVNQDFDPDTTVLTPLDFAYSLSIDPVLGAGKSFATVKLDSTCNNDPFCEVDKYINGSSTPTLTSTNGANVGPASLFGTTISVKNTFFTTGTNATLDAIVNNYTQTDNVPGPLPLLGAGAAFGFSRRLRSRIKRARLA